jgi:hypothetical protein
MDEEFDSLIVTDPDLVDPGIDVSGLRTQTDTSLLGNIPDFAGIQYEAFNPNRLSDLMRLYSTGLPIIDTPAAATPPDTGGGDSGDGGQGTIPIDTPDSIAGFDPGVTPGPSGFIGLDPEYDVSPFEFDDYGTYDPPTTPVDTSIAIEDFTTPFVTERGITGGPVEYRDQTQITDPVTLIEDLPMVQTSTDAQGNIYSMREEDYGSYLGNINDEVALTGTATPEQQEGFLQNVLGQAGQTVEGALTELGKIPGAVVDKFNETVDVFGKKLNVGKTLAGLAINRIVGGPVSLVFDALQSLPKSKSQLQYEGFNDDQRAAIDQAYGPGGVMEGYNAVSAFGKGPLETIQERIDNRYANVSDPANDPTIKKLERLRDTLGGIQAVNAVKTGAPQEDIGAIPGDTGADPTTGDLPGGGNIYDEFAPSDDKDDGSAPTSPVNEADVEAGLGTESISDFVDDFEVSGEPAPPTGGSGVDSFFDALDTATGGGDDRDDGPVSSAPGESTYDAEAEDETADDRGSGGGGGGGGGGKIVCTMMNESYGFGSFRNKIWLRHSKDLAPEYQKGYHKIFLPLVRLSKNNKILKKMLEHIAVHRTIDIRQESRGKVHLLGRVYRKILEPICYWVGKYAK